MAKRALDLVLTSIALILLSPFMLLIALAIKIDDRGPVFFKQKRLTLDGKVFEVYKFRSMVVDAEKDGVARLATQHDDRITRVGRFLRKVRMDELPQLINVFKGDMSIVGPRPERPEIAEQYKETMPEFDFRLKVKAGLTGYAQILGKYNTLPYDKLKMDLIYICLLYTSRPRKPIQKRFPCCDHTSHSSLRRKFLYLLFLLIGFSMKLSVLYSPR